MHHPGNIALITDSTCDIPTPLLERYCIRFIPLVLIWGGEPYRDRVDIQPDEFYRRLAAGGPLPTSSQPRAEDFVHLLEQVIDEGAQEAIILPLSSQLSGTIISARQAAEMVDIPVHVVDSRTGGMALGWQLLAAARVREAGGGVAEMLQAIEQVRQTEQIIFYVDSLEYLHRGGRIGGAARLIGTALNLKPVLYVDHDIGRIEAGEKVRTRRRALERVYELFFERMDLSRPVHVAVIHSNVEELAQTVAERIRAEYNPAELLVTPISPVMGTHIGPGALGITGYYEPSAR
ncbi:MAG TPA: DegV family protein [Aggregatilineales bacterium]|nr:DegV family protein [Chloroflexota bacterium]HOA23800.1 DegV family protein [Aggregatilineales bacterium]HQA66674.1 DegV family protein [Aggregatilineales bacterium]HQE17856.1 DegV family protein [Aggregatilineales bacterium]